MTSSASRYVEIFRAAMPEGTVLFDPVQIDAGYRRNVTALERAVPLVLRPQNHDDVARVVALANQHRIPLYPFSTGKNWGLGSKLPVIDGCALVDLAALNQIAWVSEEGPYVVIGPGVTQGQLAAYLAEHHPQFSFNVTGSFAHTSIVGNVLERGDGACARIDDLLGVRGVLGNGTPFQTGGVWDNKHLPAHGARYSAGPDLTALFSQSNFAIVTQMAFRLSRKPERRFVFWGMSKDEQLERVLDTFRHFGEQKVLNPGSVNIGYANRFVQAASTLATGPATPTDISLARFPSPASVATSISKSEPTAPEWNFYALVEGSRRMTDAAITELTDAFGAFCRVGAYATDSSEDPYQVLPSFLHPLVKPLIGVPDHRSIQLIYQLTGTAAPADPARMDADFTPFGMKCCIPMVPTNGVDGRRVASLVAQVRERHALNVKLSFFGDGRTLITIHFRSDDAEQVRRATACEAELWDRLAEGGFPPYRASIEQMDRLCSLRPDFFSVVQQLKSTLDPNGVIAPGRYCPKP